MGGDLRQALRMLMKMPGVAAVAIVSVGIGIGVNAAVFSWIQAVVFKPLPGLAHASSFYSIEAVAEAGGYPGMSWPDYRDLRERLSAFHELLAFRMEAGG